MSRWLETPAHVTERPGDLPAGFRAAGVAAGLKPSGARDVALLVSDPPDTVSAARFTRSGVLAAPVVLCQKRVRLDAIRAVVVNSGNANAATGNRGLEDAARMQGAAAMAAGVREDQVAVASTGVIGVPLDAREVIKGIAAARPRLREDGAEEFSEAIRTTDKFAKDVAVDIALPSGSIRLTAQAKGAGMISPAFATMLCFVQTDATLAPESADLLLGVCVKRSFDRVSVDGQLSTNDTAILMCSGASGVAIEPESEDELRFGEALDWALRRLALDIVRDGEGSRRIAARARAGARGGHRGARRPGGRELAAGEGRAARRRRELGPDRAGGGRSRVGSAAWRRTSGSRVCRCARAVSACRSTGSSWGEEVEYTVALGGEAEAEVFFSDLSHEYVTINADYTT